MSYVEGYHSYFHNSYHSCCFHWPQSPALLPSAHCIKLRRILSWGYFVEIWEYKVEHVSWKGHRYFYCLCRSVQHGLIALNQARKHGANSCTKFYRKQFIQSRTAFRFHPLNCHKDFMHNWQKKVGFHWLEEVAVRPFLKCNLVVISLVYFCVPHELKPKRLQKMHRRFQVSRG